MTGLRIGHGFDAHRFAEGRRMVLGGVAIDHPVGLAGHSDADVVLHAVCDALLGAAAMGDIGGMFPDSDEAHRNASSLEFLEKVRQRLEAAGYKVVNVDATIAAQAPRMAPYAKAMRENIARAAGTGLDEVSVKATTTEKMGFTGRGEGIAAWAVALIEKERREP